MIFTAPYSVPNITNLSMDLFVVALPDGLRYLPPIIADGSPAWENPCREFTAAYPCRKRSGARCVGPTPQLQHRGFGHLLESRMRHGFLFPIARICWLLCVKNWIVVKVAYRMIIGDGTAKSKLEPSAAIIISQSKTL